MARCAIGLDLGGTKILGLLVTETGEVLGRTTVPTRAGGAEPVLEDLAAAARVLLAEAREASLEVVAIGLGAPGPLDPERGVIHSMPNLPGVEGVPLGARLSERLGLPAVLENDANAALRGELAFGAGKGHRNALLFTLGTGVGGALAIHGELVAGVTGAAGELGHIVVEPGGRRCGCGHRGCLETVASGRAVGVIGREDGVTVDEDAAAVLSAAAADHVVAQQVLTRAGHGLGQALAFLVNAVNPSICLIGGGFGTAAFERLETPIREELARGCFAIAHEALELRVAALGVEAGALGAASAAFSRVTD